MTPIYIVGQEPATHAFVVFTERIPLDSDLLAEDSYLEKQAKAACDKFGLWLKNWSLPVLESNLIPPGAPMHRFVTSTSSIYPPQRQELPLKWFRAFVETPCLGLWPDKELDPSTEFVKMKRSLTEKDAGATFVFVDSLRGPVRYKIEQISGIYEPGKVGVSEPLGAYRIVRAVEAELLERK